MVMLLCPNVILRIISFVFRYTIISSKMFMLVLLCLDRIRPGEGIDLFISNITRRILLF